ncbi:MAG: glycosyltransferase, partial [Candidatus Poseidoniaceae archaeon]|nr:glycosyltransferase [Candidatus Poseidoniaceae archaeon]
MSNDFIVALITTYNRPELLKIRALNSVKYQSLQPNQVILIDNSDEKTILETNKQNFQELFPNGIYLKNGGFPSAAGTWNFGLKYIHENYPNSWTAILDDDDEWLEDHLQNNIPYMTDYDVVLGGIRTILDGKHIEERNPKTLKIEEIFSTNPGWQGSNTFIRTKRIIEAGSFDESLLCTHDRDLAIRVLSIPEIRIIGTGITSVNYYLDNDRESLTLSKSKGKHTGLLQFFVKHKHLMKEEDKVNFISRANFFGLDKEIFSIIDKSNDEDGFPPLPKQPKTKLGKVIKNTNWRSKQSWWRFRNRPIMTKILGRQFVRSRSKIEIDLTYECNLKCHGCNRSCR